MDFDNIYSMLLLFGFIIGCIYGGTDLELQKKYIFKFENLLYIFLYALSGLIISMFLPLLIPCFGIGIISYHFVKVLMDLI